MDIRCSCYNSSRTQTPTAEKHHMQQQFALALSFLTTGQLQPGSLFQLPPRNVVGSITPPAGSMRKQVTAHLIFVHCVGPKESIGLDWRKELTSGMCPLRCRHPKSARRAMIWQPDPAKARLHDHSQPLPKKKKKQAPFR